MSGHFLFGSVQGPEAGSVRYWFACGGNLTHWRFWILVRYPLLPSFSASAFLIESCGNSLIYWVCFLAPVLSFEVVLILALWVGLEPGRDGAGAIFIFHTSVVAPVTLLGFIDFTLMLQVGHRVGPCKG